MRQKLSVPFIFLIWNSFQRRKLQPTQLGPFRNSACTRHQFLLLLACNAFSPWQEELDLSQFQNY